MDENNLDKLNIYLIKERTLGNDYRIVGGDFIEVVPSSSVKDNQTFHLNIIVGMDNYLSVKEGGWDEKRQNFNLNIKSEKTNDDKIILRKTDVMVGTIVISKATAKMLFESLKHFNID